MAGKLAAVCCRVAMLLCALPASALDLDSLSLPRGFHISVYVDHVPQARELAVGAQGTVFIGSSGAGKVYAARDRDGDGVAEQVTVLAHDLYLPAGVALRDGDLYVGEVDRVLRFNDIEAHLEPPPTPMAVFEQLPHESHHGMKYLKFNAAGDLFLGIGAPCNICAAEPPYALLLRLPAAGGEPEIFARGIRNTVGFDWRPGTDELWFGDNGRDELGDDLPADEVNRAPRAGLHFGFPHVHGGDLLDTEFGAGHHAREFEPPALKLGAHVAPLGVMFYRGTQFPAAYRNALFVAEHGSWNRSHKSGYRVMVATIDGRGVVQRYVPFIVGWLREEESWGRPVAFATLADGSLLISDDEAGVVYRVTYAAP